MTRPHRFTPFAFFSACTMALCLLASSAVAQAPPSDCQSDADCAAGQECAVVGGTSCACAGCAPGEECPPCDCGEPEEFYGCVTPPVTCDTDADCPEYLACQNYPSMGIPCSVDSDGNSSCDEPPPTSDGGFCDFRPPSCDDGGGCDPGFSCESGPGEDFACPAICEDDGEGGCLPCEAPEPIGGGAGQCYPDEIACDADSDCPADWSCHGFTFDNCSGGGSIGSDCACAACPSEEDCPPCDCGDPVAPEPVECTAETQSYCIPAGWEDFVDSYASAGAAESGPSQSGASESLFGGGDDSDDGGLFRGGSGEGGGTSNTGGGDGDDGGGRSSDSCTISSTSSPVAPSGAIIMLLGALGLTVARRR